MLKLGLSIERYLCEVDADLFAYQYVPEPGIRIGAIVVSPSLLGEIKKIQGSRPTLILRREQARKEKKV
jgi:hypothetical protein